MLRKLAPALIAPILVAPACAQEADRSALEAAAPVAALRAAPELAADAGSARFEITFVFDVPEGPLELRATGGYDGDRMRMEMDLGSMLAGLAEQAGEALPPGLDEPMQVVGEGDTVYLRMPMLDELTGTSGWLSATPDDLGTSGRSLGLTGTTTHPSQLLDTLRGITDDLESCGAVAIRGVDTTCYAGTIDVDDVLDAVPAEQRDVIETQLDELAGRSIGSLPVQVWVDGEGLARRMRMSFDELGNAMGVPGSAVMTLEVFDYGEPLEIAIPSSDEVTPIGEVLPGMGG